MHSSSLAADPHAIRDFAYVRAPRGHYPIGLHNDYEEHFKLSFAVLFHGIGGRAAWHIRVLAR